MSTKNPKLRDQVAALEQRLDSLATTVSQLQAENAELREDLRAYQHLVWELRRQATFDQNAIGRAHRRLDAIEARYGPARKPLRIVG